MVLTAARFALKSCQRMTCSGYGDTVSECTMRAECTSMSLLQGVR